MKYNAKILITGAGGFLGSKVAYKLQESGFVNIRCLVRSTKSLENLKKMDPCFSRDVFEYVEADLTRKPDVEKALEGVAVVINCAAKKGGPPASMILNSVVTLRNLLEAARKSKTLSRIIHISSFSVYGTAVLKRHTTVDEDTPLEKNLKRRGDAYTYVKIKQEQLINDYQHRFNLPIVIVRPGVIYGPGGDEISRRVGFNLFGIFLNIGRKNMMPLSYVDNCAEAIVLVANAPGIEGETINIHDTDLLTCNEFLDRYRQEVKTIRVIKVAYRIFWLFSWMVDAYARYSKEQIPAILSSYKTASIWKPLNFSNDKLIKKTGWSQHVSTEEGLARHFRYYAKLNAQGPGTA